MNNGSLGSQKRAGGTYQTQRTDFGRKRRGGTDLTTGCPQVDDLDLIGVLAKRSVSRALFGYGNTAGTHEFGGHGE